MDMTWESGRRCRRTALDMADRDEGANGIAWTTSATKENSLRLSCDCARSSESTPPMR